MQCAAGWGEAAKMVSTSIRRVAAKKLRANTTPHERLLWRALREIPTDGTHFRRQAPIGPQPKVALESGKVVGAEALARWRTAEFGLVSPTVFIPIAEDAGLMPQLTDRILSSAMSQGRKLIERNPGFTIAVNISGSLMADLTLPDRIEEILRQEKIPPSALTVEITETTAMADVERANDILVRLRIKNSATRSSRSTRWRAENENPGRGATGVSGQARYQ